MDAAITLFISLVEFYTDGDNGSHCSLRLLIEGLGEAVAVAPVAGGHGHNTGKNNRAELGFRVPEGVGYDSGGMNTDSFGGKTDLGR
jgi:hypothetical protein